MVSFPIGFISAAVPCVYGTKTSEESCAALLAAQEEDELSAFNPPSTYHDFIQKSHGGNQAVFARESLRIVKEASELIKNDKENPNLLKNILDFLAEQRRQIARALGSSVADDLGVWLEGDEFVYTHLNGQYEYYRTKAIKELNDIFNTRKKICDASNSVFHHLGAGFLSAVLSINKSTLNDFMNNTDLTLGSPEGVRGITHSRFGVFLNGLQLPELSDGICHVKYNFFFVNSQSVQLSKVVYLVPNDDETPDKVVITNAVKSTMEKILGFLKPIFSDVVQSKNGDDEDVLIDKIAEIHFLLAHLTPFRRGSASIIEYLIKATLMSHGFKLVPYKDPIRPDLEAQVSTLVDFKEQYSTFYEGSLTTPRFI